MHVLVTGSSGFVGRHFVKHLVEKGHIVTEVDTQEGEDCLHFFRNHTSRFDLALHCAAIVGGRKHIENKKLDVATNLALDSWFFQWLELSKTPRAVYFSSSAAYPARKNVRDSYLKESDFSFTEIPDETYGLVKQVGERLAQESSAKVTVVRPFSGYGEDQDKSYPFAAFIDRARRRADPFEIWGNGDQERDWIHIDDIVAATMTAVDLEILDPVNLCTGLGTSMNVLVSQILKKVEPVYQPAILHLLDAPKGVPFRVGDPQRLKQFYRVKVSLDEGIERALSHE